MHQLPNFIDLQKISETSYMLTNNVTQTYIKIGNIEAQYLLDIYIGQDTTSNFLSKEQQQFLRENYEELGFLSEEKSIELSRKKRKSELSRIYLFRMNPSNLLSKNKWLYTGKYIPMILSILLTIVIVGMAILFLNINEWLSTVNFSKVNIGIIISMYILITLTILIHEAAHAILCYRFGGKVKEVGVMFIYLSLAFYCDISSIYLFKKKRHKLLVLLGGVFSQIILICISSILCSILFSQGKNIDLLIYYIGFNVISIILNLSPIIKLDGYWILVQLTNITNLREKSVKYLLSFQGREYKEYRNKFNVTEKTILFIYGLVSSMGILGIWLYSIYYLNKLTKIYIDQWSIYVVITWSIIIIYHVIKKLVKYQRILKNDIAF
ncbi:MULTISPECIES: M50 family metallopeptidase [Bacillus cereus group]|uniref:M50 family metallopeptidase n=1 Tax=Bacillus cereus group TaxID=86661 RepID=UPI00039D025E|nr:MULTISPECIES: M50 family metallopeptidase [Bacillus cereus group]MCZ6940553.1 M50 family peptidase [Bacillus mycoides]